MPWMNVDIMIIKKLIERLELKMSVLNGENKQILDQWKGDKQYAKI